MKPFQSYSFYTSLLLTGLGSIYHSTTIFYVLYLFWLEEVIRTIVDYVYVRKHKNELMNMEVSNNINLTSIGAIVFVMFIYFVFIVVLFGFVLGLNNKQEMYINIKTFVFKNWFFNLNLVAFAFAYSRYRWEAKQDNLVLAAFNKRHIILHVSIILGAIIHSFIVEKHKIASAYSYFLVLLPFFLLKKMLLKENI